eukprot:12673815-Alexandrium_andersonii.AAC.1
MCIRDRDSRGGRCILLTSLRCSTSGVLTLLRGPPAWSARPFAPSPVRELYLEERCRPCPAR